MHLPPAAAFGLLLLLLPPPAAMTSRKTTLCQKCRTLVDKFNQVSGQRARDSGSGRGASGVHSGPPSRCHLLRRGWPTRPGRTSAAATRRGRRRRCPSTNPGGCPRTARIGGHGLEPPALLRASGFLG
ncbi:hypothetical protein U0070_006237 [Myodes glareolus]|uniref:Uncharacterized protein n=1 Tax=Myodes glareolus TaxID=447135 RepID=A0AAW0I6G2_MYOGA